MRAKLSEVKEQLRRQMHQPIPEQGRWLAQVIRGYFAYHAVPTNYSALNAFRYHHHPRWEPYALIGLVRIWCSESSCHSSG